MSHDVESITERVYEQLSPHYESMSLKTRPTRHIIMEWEEAGPVLWREMFPNE